MIAIVLALLQNYPPVGAPSDPKVPAQWNRYRDHAEATKLLQALAKAFPSLCRLESLGKSHGGREMWVLTLSAKGAASAKPAFWIDGGIHANEIQGPEVVLYTAWYLLEMYGRNATVTRLLDERTFYLLPILSPDSRDAHMRKPNTTHSPRGGERPVDDDRDGLFDEDGADDLDGDGHVTQMRVRDPNGRWKAHPEHPLLLVPCKPDEKGEFTILGDEGVDSDGDGRVNEDGPGYYDPNRNWGWNWQPPHVQPGAHHYPFSILENRLAADFIAAHPNIAGAQSYHNAAGMILRGPGDRNEHWDDADVAVFDQIARQGEKILPGYRYLDIANELYPAFGVEIAWRYAMRGIFGFTNELFTPFNLFREHGGGWFGRPEDLHRFDRYLLFGDGIVAWHAVDHPQYGRIEVGGFKKSWVRQPPSFLLEEECHRNMAFTLHHADQMAQVKVRSIETRELGGGLVEVTAAVSNLKLMPTRSVADVQRRISPPDLVTLSGAKVVAGLLSTDRFFERSTEQKRRPHELRVDRIPGMGTIYARWIVKGAGPYEVTIRSAKGEVDSLRK